MLATKLTVTLPSILQNVKGTPPCKRYGHTATLWNNCIIVFGSLFFILSCKEILNICLLGGCNERTEYCSDVHIFDLEKSTWHQPTVYGEVPARYLHSAVVSDNKLFVYGGFARNAECKLTVDSGGKKRRRESKHTHLHKYRYLCAR